VAGALADRVIVTSDNPRSEAPAAILEDIRQGLPPEADAAFLVDRRDAIRAAVREARAGDVILVAGKGHETYQETRGVQTPFDDVTEVYRAMELDSPGSPG
ncbi:MAG: UDP-N-acetylmuramoyl-L-alanyl-D-glutamate--2,6-diaminopimelate ligase, partial [Lentisphaeria bacterium]|nr:UDP-N-acetylmuramoyl-L-alanyl-D-glutamate--2,6-diaminopimelate ligase [Lentisphaeria bacterium]